MKFLDYKHRFARDLKHAAKEWKTDQSSSSSSDSPSACSAQDSKPFGRVPKKRRRSHVISDSDSEVITIKDSSDDYEGSDDIVIVEKGDRELRKAKEQG